MALIKAFLKAGIMSEQGRLQGTVTGTPQGGILSPLMANVALSALDEHFARAWEQTGGQHGRSARRRPPRRGRPTGSSATPMTSSSSWQASGGTPRR